MKTVKALLVNPDGSGRLIDISPALQDLRAAIGGGWLQLIPLSDGAHIYCDDDGKPTRLALNPAATELANLAGWPVGDVLRGPVLFLGHRRDGAEADVPADLLQMWGLLTGVPA